jgi:hypothetical protein
MLFDVPTSQVKPVTIRLASVRVVRMWTCAPWPTNAEHFPYPRAIRSIVDGVGAQRIGSNATLERHDTCRQLSAHRASDPGLPVIVEYCRV